MKKNLRRIIALAMLVAMVAAFSLLGGVSAAKEETVTINVYN